MSGQERRFFSADSLQRAILQAASHFGVEPDRVAYRTLEKKHGFVKAGRKFLIEVDPSSPELPAGVKPPHLALPERPTPTRAPEMRPAAPLAQRERRQDGDRGGRRSERPRDGRGPERGNRGNRSNGQDRPGGRGRGEGGGVRRREELLVPLPDVPRRLADRYPPAEGEVAAAAREATELLLRIAGVRLEPTVLQGAERIEIDLEGRDREVCFRDGGELLFALEHLVPRLVRPKLGESFLCRVDCDSFHAIREEQLRTLAQRVASEVGKSGASQMLEPMNPGDRRVVHMTLADDASVTTESDGDGYFKRIVVRPA